MFLWRACSNNLPTRRNLIKRRCVREDFCGLCGEESETVDHVLLKCKNVSPVWYRSQLRLDTTRDEVGSFKDLLWTIMENYPVEYTALVGYTAWTIWKHRNMKYFDDKGFDFSKMGGLGWDL